MEPTLQEELESQAVSLRRRDWASKREGRHLPRYSFSLKTKGMLQSTRGVTCVIEETNGSSSEYMQF